MLGDGRRQTSQPRSTRPILGTGSVLLNWPTCRAVEPSKGAWSWKTPDYRAPLRLFCSSRPAHRQGAGTCFRKHRMRWSGFRCLEAWRHPWSLFFQTRAFPHRRTRPTCLNREDDAAATTPANPQLAADDQQSVVAEDPDHQIALWEQLIGGVREIQETLENLNQSPELRGERHNADAGRLETWLAHIQRRLEYPQGRHDTR
jgi:hypothetical protein